MICLYLSSLKKGFGSICSCETTHFDLFIHCTHFRHKSSFLNNTQDFRTQDCSFYLQSYNVPQVQIFSMLCRINKSLNAGCPTRFFLCSSSTVIFVIFSRNNQYPNYVELSTGNKSQNTNLQNFIWNTNLQNFIWSIIKSFYKFSSAFCGFQQYEMGGKLLKA